jgi:hypothetical protein
MFAVHVIVSTSLRFTGSEIRQTVFTKKTCYECVVEGDPVAMVMIQVLSPAFPFRPSLYSFPQERLRTRHINVQEVNARRRHQLPSDSETTSRSEEWSGARA